LKKRLSPSKLLFIVAIFAFIGLVFWANVDVSKDLARLERILALLEVHPDLLWKQRPDLDTTFEGAHVLTDTQGFRLQNPDDKRTTAKDTNESLTVLTLGASPTFGYGVEADQTYSAVAEKLIKKQYPNAKIINAGQIGYSSWQGLKLLEKHFNDFKPDVLTVSYVVNDIDRLRFFFSNGKGDYQTEPPNSSKAAIGNWLNDTWPFSALARQQRRVLVKLFSNISRKGQYELTHVRSTPEEYEKNLKRFIEFAHIKNVPLLFIEMPFRLPEKLPAKIAEANAKLDQVEEKLKAGKLEAAQELLDSLYENDCKKSRMHYLQGLIWEEQGYQGKAKKYFKKAMEHVIYDCARDARLYNKIMEKVARETDTAIVNPAARLGDLAADMEYFVPNDYIHPNKEGHEIIGKCVGIALYRIMAGDRSGFVQECK